MLGPYERSLIGHINNIVPDAFERLEEISSFEHEKACRIVSEILESGCVATHVGAILAGRKAFKRLPPEWVRTNLPAIIPQSLNLEDEWDYRRLLELLKESNSDLLSTYIKKGLESNDPEINEAAGDY